MPEVAQTRTGALAAPGATTTAPSLPDDRTPATSDGLGRTTGPACNACGAAMRLAADAVVPAWECACGRLVPRWPGDTARGTERKR